MLSWLVVSPAKKTSSNIWWIGKVVVPLHSQLKRTGFRKCLSLMSGEQVLLVSVTLGAPIYNRCKTHEWGARKKTSPKIWWFQKVVVPLHSQLQRKGGRKCPIHGWSLVAMMTDRNACGVYMMTHCQADLETRWGVCWKGSPTDESRSAKKTSPKIWWFQKLVVPLHSQPTRKGSSLFTCEEVLSWSF